jgi:hypothetical protein
MRRWKMTRADRIAKRFREKMEVEEMNPEIKMVKIEADKLNLEKEAMALIKDAGVDVEKQGKWLKEETTRASRMEEFIDKATDYVVKVDPALDRDKLEIAKELISNAQDDVIKEAEYGGPYEVEVHTVLKTATSPERVAILNRSGNLNINGWAKGLTSIDITGVKDITEADVEVEKISGDTEVVALTLTDIHGCKKKLQIFVRS